MDIKIDSGAKANLLSEKDFTKVLPKFQQQAKLRPPKEKLTAYGGILSQLVENVSCAVEI